MHELDIPEPGSLWSWYTTAHDPITHVPSYFEGLCIVVANDVAGQRLIVVGTTGNEKGVKCVGLDWYSMQWWELLDRRLEEAAVQPHDDVE